MPSRAMTATKSAQLLMQSLPSVVLARAMPAERRPLRLCVTVAHNVAKSFCRFPAGGSLTI